MLSADFGETIKNFFTTGNNLYIVIAIAVAIVALIVIIVVSAPKKKNKKNAEESTESAVSEEASEIEPSEANETEVADVAAITADKESESLKKDTETEASETNSKAEKSSNERGDAADKVANPERAAKKTQAKPSEKKEKEAKSAGKDGEKTEKNADLPKAKKAEKSAKPEDETAASSAAIEIPDDETYESDPELTEEDGKETRPGTVEIYKDARGEFHFRFRAMNGSIVGHSQAYKSKDGCKNGIRSVISCCEDVMIADTTKKDSDYVQTIGRAAFEIYRDNAGQFRYRLVAKNASNILASQGYTNKTNCIKGAESIIRMSKNHIIDDETIQRKPKDAE